VKIRKKKNKPEEKATDRAAKTAKYFIYKAGEDQSTITNAKLQKLVYYAQAWNLVFNKKRLFKDPVQAWMEGPVVNSLFFHYWYKYDSGNITLCVLTKFDFTRQEEQVLDEVYSAYGIHTADYLRTLVHDERPWRDARDGIVNFDSDKLRIPVITAGSMKKFYGARYKKKGIFRYGVVK